MKINIKETSRENDYDEFMRTYHKGFEVSPGEH